MAVEASPERPVAAGPLAGRGRVLRAVAFNPMQLIPLAVAPVFIPLRHAHYVANVPIWLLVGSIVFTQIATSIASVVWPAGGKNWTLSARTGVRVVLAGSIIYLTGWGAALALGLVFVAAEQVRMDGARAARYALPWIVGVIAAGEIAVGAHWIQSLMPEPQGHGLAVLSAIAVCVICVIFGVTTATKERVEIELRQREERFRALVQHSSDLILVIDTNFDIAYASPSASRLLGRERPDLGKHVIHPDDRERASAFFRDVTDRPGELSRLDVRLQHVDGTYRCFEVGVTNRFADPNVGGLVCNMRDVTDRREFEDRLAYQAYHDDLTQLPNRAAFIERLELELAALRTGGDTLAVVFLDIDRFKLVNDSLGHDVGDRLLVEVADRLRGCLRPRDIVARFGGDEFTLLLCDLQHPNDAVAVAERVTELLHQPMTIGTREVFATASIGIALSNDGREAPGDLLRQADLAMYLAKEHGRARWEFFDHRSAPHVVERLELEGELWRAIENEELVVRFQPEVRLATGQVTTAEALVRWQHPRRGLLDPGQFVPFAEESSLIVAIDRYVLRNACMHVKEWSQHTGDGRRVVVSVNLSPRFMRQPTVVTDITAIIRETGVDPRCLQLEITERTALTDVETTVVRLHELRALGIRVAIDDFGTGYSSLGYLKRLPVDVVKLDRSFVESMDLQRSDLAIVQAVITMGHALGMKVTAEGVERAAQAAHLRALGCDCAMGWLWSPALPPEELIEKIREGMPVPGDPADGSVLPFRAREAS
jgi:diguanylate cyclase (GGDEF)-like protein/PAS domain S-box-containing protein